ncbi:hypothetical protein [Pseudomonas halotolerans]|uniref:hypothetical protein n=1 Tax=Pseudomonas halotolerans TaxID=3143552 RepID=UPI0031E2B1E1
MKKLMIYGATGYTGRMAAEHAKTLGLDFVIAGRNGGRLQPLAAQLDVAYRVFSPDAHAHPHTFSGCGGAAGAGRRAAGRL